MGILSANLKRLDKVTDKWIHRFTRFDAMRLEVLES
jgi:hypothetical protein